jgi:probable phosphoglycerate mutase
MRFRPPPGATEILLVRHGESQAFEEGVRPPVLDGYADPPLAEGGTVQAAQLAKRLARGRIDALYVTPLTRTKETAQPLADLTGLEPIVEQDLREVHLGEWEAAGLFRKMIAERNPLALEMLQAQRWDVIPGAESNEHLADRVRAGLERIVAAHPDGRVVAVAHAGVVATAAMLATGSSPFAFVSVDNASISSIVVAGDRWILRRFNDTAHLDEVG